MGATPTPAPLWFRTTCQYNGLEVSDHQLDQMASFAAKLKEWNQKINLISRRDEENVWSAHILHSTTILVKVNLPHGASVLDLGTGGGLPGIPLKILRPDLEVTLLDATQKKIMVAQEMITGLGLTKIQTRWGRAEDPEVKHSLSHRFDFVVARAVAPLRDLVRWSLPLITKLGAGRTGDDAQPSTGRISKVQGTIPSLIALKGGDLQGEIRQIKTMKEVGNITVVDLTLEGSNQLEGAEKKIVVVELETGRGQKAN